MQLYKFVPSESIAKQVALGILRFYELTKYRKLEEDTGRSDTTEGSLQFTAHEIENFMEKLPKGSLNGVEFSVGCVSPDEAYLSQYFVFCMSTKNSKSAIDGCGYMVELHTDMFESLEILLPTPDSPEADERGMKFFSHGMIDYYDIHRHPESISGRRYREAYVKHSTFSHQNEYRSAMFVSETYFQRAGKEAIIYRKPAKDCAGNSVDFMVEITSGVDEAGWRYLELDFSKFQLDLLQSEVEFTVLQT